MKKILLFAAFATLTATAQAQTDKREMRQTMEPRERAEMQAQHMQKKLSLSDDQMTKIREINLQTMPADKDMAASDKKGMRSERMEMMQKREEMYKQVLTPDQMDRYQKLKAERMEKMQDKRRERMNISEGTTPQR